MSSDDRPARRVAAGQWLRATRQRHGYYKAVDFARALDVDPSLISNYERGVSEVPTERAEQIAELLGLDEIEVRRNLGLWTRPKSAADEPDPSLPAEASDDPVLVEMWAGLNDDERREALAEAIATARSLRRVPEELRTDPEFVALWRQLNPKEQRIALRQATRNARQQTRKQARDNLVMIVEAKIGDEPAG